MAGGAGAAGRTLEIERLAGDDGRHEMAHVGGVGVCHPGHDLFVRAHVRRHHVGFRADERDHLHREAAGEAFEFAGGHGARITGDAALATAEGQVHQRAFPRHPHGEGGDFAEIDGRVVAQSALGGAAGEVVLHAVAEKNLGRAVIAADRHGHGDESLRPLAAFAQVFG